jgi:hypothetical protein
LALVAIRQPEWMVPLLVVAAAAGIVMYFVIERRQPFNTDNFTR